MRLKEPSRISPQVQETLTVRRGWIKALGLGIAATLLRNGSWSRLLAQGSNRDAAAGKSVQLHIYIEVKPGKGPELEKLYHSAYVPAIGVQEGFLWSRLLRHYDSNNKYEIDISFKTEKQRAAWAQSKEHQNAWPKIEEVGAKINWQGFDQLA
jgi:heme-degrading monooxygenase HmoA